MGKHFAVNVECAQLGIVPAGSVVDGAFLDERLHATVEIAVTHGKDALSVVVVENVFKELLCPGSQLPGIFNAGRKLRWRQGNVFDKVSGVFSPVALAQQWGIDDGQLQFAVDNVGRYACALQVTAEKNVVILGA